MQHTKGMYWARFLVAFLWIFLGGAAYGQSVSSHADETAIRDLIQKYMDARNNKDAEKTRSLFTEDADQLVSTGEWRKGIDAVVRGAMASSQKEAAKSSIQVEAIRFLDPGIALVDGRYETVSAATGASRKMWATLVVKRVGQDWRIAAIRNMLPAPNSVSAPH
ncbi:MAG: SgcJ/EcaC family oxidoreductase [Bryobacteraceae bacterium]